MTTQLGPGIDFAHRQLAKLMSTGQLAAFAVLVGIYCLTSVLVGFWLAWRNYHRKG